MAEIGSLREQAAESITAHKALCDKYDQSAAQNQANSECIRDLLRQLSDVNGELKQVRAALEIGSRDKAQVMEAKGQVETQLLEARKALILEKEVQNQNRQEIAVERDSHKITQRALSTTGSLLSSTREKVGELETAVQTATDLTFKTRKACGYEHSRSIRMFLSVFTASGGQKASMTDETAVSLSKRLASFNDIRLARMAVRRGVEECCGTMNLPGSSALPLLRIVHHLHQHASSEIETTLAEPLQWREVEFLGIELFQSKFVSDMKASLAKIKGTLTAETLTERISELLDPLIGMDNLEAILLPAITPILGIVFDPRMVDDFPALSRPELRQGLKGKSRPFVLSEI